MSDEPCLSAADLGSYLDRTGEPSQRERSEGHLALCAACTARLAELYRCRQAERMPVPRLPDHVRRVVEELPQRGGTAPAPSRRGLPGWSLPASIAGRRLPPWTVPVALAATLVLAVSWALFSPQALDDGARAGYRALEEGVPAPVPLAPAAGARLTEPESDFRWREIPGAASYVVIVLDEHGDLLFRGESLEPHLRLHRGKLPLATGGTCFWYVEAQFPDGSRSSSEPAKLFW